MGMKDESSPFKLLRTEWVRVKCLGHPIRSWLAQVELLRKELGLQDQVLNLKLVKRVVDKRECEEFEMVLQH